MLAEFDEMYGTIVAQIEDTQVEGGYVWGLSLKILETSPVGGNPPLPETLVGQLITTSALAFAADLEGYEEEGKLQKAQTVRGVLQYLLLDRDVDAGSNVASFIFSLESVE